MQRLVETGIEINKKVTAGEELPETMILYAMDLDHFIVTVKPLKTFEENALTKMNVKVIRQQDSYLIVVPQKVYNFYHLDEKDYTAMASDKDPTTIIVTI